MRKDGILGEMQLSGGGGWCAGEACGGRISCKLSELMSVQEMMKEMKFLRTLSELPLSLLRR